MKKTIALALFALAASAWAADARLGGYPGRTGQEPTGRSSGSTSLDEEALATVRRASPFPAPPRQLAGDHVHLRVPIRFVASNPPAEE